MIAPCGLGIRSFEIQWMLILITIVVALQKSLDKPMKAYLVYME